MKTGIYSYVKENMKIRRKFLTSLCCLLLCLCPILGFSQVKIVLISDVSGSVVGGIGNEDNMMISDALIMALKNSLNRYDWELGVLGSSIASSKVSTTVVQFPSWNKTTYVNSISITAMSFVGFPEDSILEFQSVNVNPGSINQAIIESIRMHEKPISSQNPRYEQLIRSTFEEIDGWMDDKLHSMHFGHASSDEMFNAPVVVSLSNNPDFLDGAELLVILYLLTDSEDMSSDSGGRNRAAWQGITKEEYLTFLVDLMGGDINRIFMAGAFTDPDLRTPDYHYKTHCVSELDFTVTGSSYEYLINSTTQKSDKAIISLCDSQEGIQQSFVNLFERIAKRMDLLSNN